MSQAPSKLRGMIVPNLMVSDLPASLDFYLGVIGLELGFRIDAAHRMVEGDSHEGAVFATLKWGEHELMLQTVASMSEDVPGMTADQAPTPGGTVYFRGFEPDAIAERAGEAVIRGPIQQWYGMREVYVRDPDGHVLCFGVPVGDAPS